tara:strand:+ start:486 stop:1049 length:564 start_codon:yes stop_codon:yes gene_type:complete
MQIDTTETCAICRCAFNSNDSYKLSECGHTFHTECIIKWWRSPRYGTDEEADHTGGTCPLCRGLPRNIFRWSETMERGLLIKKYGSKSNNPYIRRTVLKLKKKEKELKEHREKVNKLKKSKEYLDVKNKIRDYNKKTRDLQEYIRKKYVHLSATGNHMIIEIPYEQKEKKLHTITDDSLWIEFTENE